MQYDFKKFYLSLFENTRQINTCKHEIVKRDTICSVGFLFYDRFIIILSQRQKTCQFREQKY